MKKLIKLFYVGLVILFIVPMLLTSCQSNGLEGGNAPKDVSGMTMTMIDSEGDHWLTIHFHSNTSATLDKKYGWNEKYSYTSLQYKKTGLETATLKIKGMKMYGYADGEYWEHVEGDKDYSFVFISPNEGTVKGNIANGLGMFTLF